MESVGSKVYVEIPEKYFTNDIMNDIQEKRFLDVEAVTKDYEKELNNLWFKVDTTNNNVAEHQGIKVGDYVLINMLLWVESATRLLQIGDKKLMKVDIHFIDMVKHEA